MYLCRPKFEIRSNQQYCREMVGVNGSAGVMLRVFVENSGRWFSAKKSKVIIERIWRGGKVVEKERSELQWKDVLPDPTFETEIASRRHAYADVCLSAKNRPGMLGIRSVRGRRGYNLTQPGIYIFEISVETAGLYSGCFAELEVNYGKAWDDLDILSISRRRRPLMWDGI